MTAEIIRRRKSRTIDVPNVSYCATSRVIAAVPTLSE